MAEVFLAATAPNWWILIPASLVVIALLAVAFAVIIAVAAKKFYVETNPLVAELLEIMPGINCGACGEPGCLGYSEALADNRTAPNLCSPGGSKVTKQICEILGLEAVSSAPTVAVLKCMGGTCCEDRYVYDGPHDCRAAAHMMVQSGSKACSYACLELGTCAKECPYDAIYMSPVTRLPVVVESKCTGCSICAQVCPKDLYDMIPIDKQVHVRCKSQDKGPVTKKNCSTGCIACNKCVKACNYDAIHVNDFLAAVDYDKCINCHDCVPVCPTEVIHHLGEERVQFKVAETLALL